MSKKPGFVIQLNNKEKRLLEAKRELENEDIMENDDSKLISTTFLIERSLLYAVKEIALKRKKNNIKPNTVTGIIKESLKTFVDKEK